MPRASCCVLVLSLLLVLVLVLSLLRVLGLVLVLLLLQEGEAYSVRELLYALMLPSGNDAALVLVRPSPTPHPLKHTCFCALMVTTVSQGTQTFPWNGMEPHVYMGSSLRQCHIMKPCLSKPCL